MTPQDMWDLFIRDTDVISNYTAWQFGEDADTLANLVLEGIKTGTASMYDLYQIENEKLPQAGEYSIILNSNNDAVCIIQTVKVEIVPYNQITDKHAYDEGEGDRTLAYWKKVHQNFFTKELEKYNLEFDENRCVVYEHFKLVFSLY